MNTTTPYRIANNYERAEE